jgi:hypothetical protein
MLIDTTNTVASTLALQTRQCTEILALLEKINTKLGVIMSEDAAIQAVTAAMQGDVANLTTLMSQVASTLATALSEIGSSSTNSVSPETVTALQNQQAALDAAVQAAQNQASTEAGQVTPPAPPTA